MELENKKLAFSTNAQTYLKSIAGWGMFIAVLGFIGAFFSLGNIITGFKFNFILGLVYMGSTAVQFLAALGLSTFSSKVKSAVERRDTTNIDVAFKGLMSYFMFCLISIGITVCSMLVMFMSF